MGHVNYDGTKMVLTQRAEPQSSMKPVPVESYRRHLQWFFLFICLGHELAHAKSTTTHMCPAHGEVDVREVMHE